jgi:glycerol kinase
MAKYVGALDQGTTSNRFIIFDHSGNIVGLDQKEHEQIFPKPGWVEHNPAEIWQNTRDVIRGALADAGLSGKDLAAVGITNQRETTVLWDKHTGKPYTNAVVWQCTRTDEICRELMRDHGQNRFREKTGLPIATYFSGPKIKWVLDNVAAARRAADKGAALFGTMETWIIWWLTGGPDGGSHVTDVTNASRTMLMDLQTLQWDEEILQILDIPPGALGDQQAALVGQTCFDMGEAKNTYGTGCFLLLNTGTTPTVSRQGLLTTLGYQINDQAPVYCLEGSIAITGAQTTAVLILCRHFPACLHPTGAPMPVGSSSALPVMSTKDISPAPCWKPVPIRPATLSMP